MKEIKAVIKPFKIDDVREALARIGLTGFTVTDADGYGQQRKRSEFSKCTIPNIPKKWIELVVPDHLVDQAVAVIAAAAKTGAVGDGKVFVLPVEQAVRIRTGETGEAAV